MNQPRHLTCLGIPRVVFVWYNLHLCEETTAISTEREHRIVPRHRYQHKSTYLCLFLTSDACSLLFKFSAWKSRNAARHKSERLTESMTESWREQWTDSKLLVRAESAWSIAKAGPVFATKSAFFLCEVYVKSSFQVKNHVWDQN